MDTTNATAQYAVPRPIEPGPEMAELARFHQDVTWTGRIAAEAMGPGTPEMLATGRGVHTTIQGGRWIVGDYEQEQHLLDGTPVLVWQLHWVAGWDPAAGEYRATIADVYGHALVMRGNVDGERLVFESLGGEPVALRLTWDFTQPDAPRWRNERRIGDGAWTLVEEYALTPTRPPRESS